jgi:hypothetical protein
MLTFEVLGVRFILGDLSGLPPGACRRGDLSDFPVSLHVVVVGGVGGGKNVGQSSSESFYCDTQTHSLQGSHMDGAQMGCGLGSMGGGSNAQCQCVNGVGERYVPRGSGRLHRHCIKLLPGAKRGTVQYHKVRNSFDHRRDLIISILCLGLALD